MKKLAEKFSLVIVLKGEQFCELPYKLFGKSIQKILLSPINI